MNIRQTPNGTRRFAAAKATATASILIMLATGCAATESEKEVVVEAGLSTVTPGEFACGMSGEYRPFNFYDETNTLVGFDVEICSAIADELGLTATPVTGAFNTLVAGLQSNRYDAIIGSMAVTDERKKQVDFSDPYYETGAQLFVGEGSSIKSVEDLKDSVVGVALGTTFEEFARGLDGVGTVTTYQADVDALRDLEAGRIDAVVTQGLMGMYLAKNADIGVVAVGDVLYADAAAIPVNKENPELLAAINKALKTITDDGTFSAISMEWFGQDIG